MKKYISLLLMHRLCSAFGGTLLALAAQQGLAAAEVTYQFEDIANNGTAFDSSGQTFTLVSPMAGQIIPTFGSSLAGQNGYSSGYMDSVFGVSRSGSVGGIQAPAGQIFRAQGFDVWPSADAGNTVLSPPQSITVVGKRAGTTVATATVSSFSFSQSPAAAGGPWQRIDLTATDFATTDVDRVEFTVGGVQNYLGVDNFGYDGLGAEPPVCSTPPSQNFDAIPAGTLSPLNGSLTFAGIIYSTDAVNDALAVDTIANITGSLPSLGTGNGLSSVWFGANTGTYLQLAATNDACHFRIVSFNAEVWGHNSLNSELYTIKGYDNATELASATVNFRVSGTYGTGASTVTYTRLTTPAETTSSGDGANCGTLTFTGSGWGNIDRVRMIVADLSPNTILGMSIDNVAFAAVGSGNAAPAFVGASTSLSTYRSASATDIKSLLHVSDNDGGQTLTWSQNTAPSHGTLSFSSATASSGSADITPGGTITYTPAAAYIGPDSFSVEVSDGATNATRTISVAVAGATASAGSSSPASIINSQPSGTLTWVIAVNGFFPTTDGGSALSEAFIGEVRPISSDTTSLNNSWVPCAGQLLPIAQNAALFSLLGTTYGGNGTTTFALPDLRGRVPVGAGSGSGLSTRALGATGGQESFVVTSNGLPAHAHTYASGNTALAGGGAVIDNMQPWLALNFCVVSSGLFDDMAWVRVFAFNLIPSGHSAASGTTLPISSNPALFSLLGTTFGGNGTTTFQLPDLRGRTPIGTGTGSGLTLRALGEQGGLESIMLGVPELATHTHAYGAGQSGSTGGGQPHDTMQPFLALNVNISQFGLFGDMSQDVPAVGEVRLSARVSRPNGWLPCDDAVQSIAENEMLFVLIGTTYGGDGQSTFNLPDLSGRAIAAPGQPAGGSNHLLGEKWGGEAQTMSLAQLPDHTHSFAQPNAAPTDIAVSGNLINQSAGANAVVGMLSSTDADSSSFTYSLVSGAGSTDNSWFNLSGSTLRVNNASVVVAGNYSVRIQTDDGSGGTYGEAVTVTILDDIAPVADADSYTTLEGTMLSVTVPGVLANDTDVDALSAILVNGPSHGDLTLNANGSFSYSPPANWSGADSFTYHASDGSLNSSDTVVTLTVNAAKLTKQINGNTWMLIAGFRAFPGASLAQVDGGIKGLFTTDQNSSITNLASVFTDVTADDSHYVNSRTWTVPIRGYLLEGYEYDGTSRNIQGIIYTTEHTWANLGDQVIQPEFVSAFSPTGAALFNGSGAITPTYQYALASSYPLTPALFSDDSGDFILLGVTDGSQQGGDSFDLGFNSASNAIGIGMSDGTGTGYTVRSDFSVRGNVMAITTISDGNTYGGSGFNSGKNDTGWVMVWGLLPAPSILAQPASQAVTNGSNPTFSVEASSETPMTCQWYFNGAAITAETNASFALTNVRRDNEGSYRVDISNMFGTTQSSIASLTVNDPPVATADPVTIDEDIALTVIAAGVLANDSDFDGDALSAVLVTGPDHGSLTLNTDGSFSYAPNTNWNGTDEFIYRANDGRVNSTSATVTLVVTAVNDNPLAAVDNFSTQEDAPLIVVAPGVLTNDSDVEGPLSAVLVSSASHGSLTFNADGSFSYAPVANWHGEDSFTYKATDGALDSALVTVTLTVNSVNDAPTAVAESFSTDEDMPLSVSAPGVLANDSDVETSFSAVLVTGPANGSLTLNTDGSFTYTPNADFHGTDGFTYAATDGTAYSAETAETITVLSVNDAPVVASPIVAQAGLYGTAFNFTFDAGTFADVDGDVMSYSAADLPPGIGFDASSRTFSGTPTNAGSYLVQVVASDDQLPALTVTNPVNFTVAKAPLTITADNQNRTYGSANPELTFAYSGLVLGDDASYLDALPTISTEATRASLIGSYEITLVGASDDNYEITLVNGTLTIGQATIVATAENQSRAYGAANPQLTISYAGFANSEDSTVLDTLPTPTTTAGASSPIGDYAVTLNGGIDGNYSITLVDGTLTIAKTALTITANDASRSYRQANPAFTGTLGGLVNSDPISASYDCAATPTSPAGAYAIVTTLVDATGISSNYNVTPANGTLTVTADDPPLVTLTQSPGFYTIGTDAVNVDTNAIVTDGASLNFDGGSLTITVVSNAAADDLLELAPEGSGDGQIGLLAAEVTLGGVSFATMTGGDGTNALVFSFNTNAAPVVVQRLLRRLTFSTFDIETASRTIEVVLADGDGGASVPALRVLELNRPPVANDESISASEGINAIIPASLVLTNDTDADNDIIMILDYSALTTSGGRMSFDGTNFTYRAPVGFVGEDLFAYLIEDGRGGESAGILAINTVPLNRVALDLSAVNSPGTDAGAHLQMGGTPSGSYRFETSPDLTTWTFLTNTVASPAGFLEVIDLDAKDHPTRFYRAIRQ